MSSTKIEPSPIRAWALALLAGLVAGLASWLIGEGLNGRIQPRLLATNGFPTPEEALAAANASKAAVALQMSVAYGTLGAALGLTLGLAGGGMRRETRSAGGAAAIGAILGGVVGAVLPQAVVPVYFKYYDPDSDDLVLAILTLGGIAGAVGASAGASLGMGLGGRGRISRAAVGGLVGAIAGIVLYVVAGTLAFPLDQTTKPISATSGSRLAARLLVALFAAAGATMVVRSTPKAHPVSFQDA
ncbi:hypothetical protein EP7_003010 [Isosphaeraceae bacterium EP7]